MKRAVIFEEFLIWEELSALMEYTIVREHDFRTSRVVAHSDPAYQDHRRSRVLLDAGPFHEVIAERIKFYFTRIVEGLECSHFDVARVESQITASNDGDYFRLHSDNTRGCAPSREISYVYFFHREPKPFHGGELVLYDPQVVIGERINPEQNDIVFFRSSCLHEILPVGCSSSRFCDSRFTINGWIHRRGPRDALQ
jgi:SM-20-related protein